MRLPILGIIWVMTLYGPPHDFGIGASPFTKEMFLQETDIIATIKGFGLDVNKFWWAVLFVYDWSIEKFTKCC